ncbi:MAG: pyridoxamine kinase [Negativicutes bacterium]|nr:pyridoxamine kinase [Negativicutes bacterium]
MKLPGNSTAGSLERPVFPPRVAAIHDLSCFGRCALAVVIPIMSRLGIQVCPLPTALLSSHLDGYRHIAIFDLSRQMTEIFQAWQQEGVEFDAIYSGFLADAGQVEIVSRFISLFKRSNTLVMVDPVLGDDGRYYSGFDQRMTEKMRQLLPLADIITPNYTEACFLLGEDYRLTGVDDTIIAGYLRRLAAMGPGRVVITGTPGPPGCLLNAAYDRLNGTYSQVSNPFIECRYPGTGDTYASVLLGCLLRGRDWEEALAAAGQFVLDAVKITWQSGGIRREGVLLETVLARPELWGVSQVVENNRGGDSAGSHDPIILRGRWGMVSSDLLADIKVGIGTIDRDHQEMAVFLARLERMVEIGQAAVNRQVIEETLSRLDWYVEQHFDREEQMMKDYGYPEAARHVAEHQFCRSKVRMFHRALAADSRDLAKTVLNFLRGWMIAHFLRSDKQLGEYVKACEQRYGTGE